MAYRKKFFAEKCDDCIYKCYGKSCITCDERSKCECLLEPSKRELKKRNCRYYIPYGTKNIFYKIKERFTRRKRK